MTTRSNKPTQPDGASGKSSVSLKTSPETPGGKSSVSLKTSPETPSTRSPPPVRDSMEDMRTHVFDSGSLKRPTGETHVNDTIVDGIDFTAPPFGGAAGQAQGPAGGAIDPATYQKATAIEDSGSFRREASTPIKVVSMKAAEAAAEKAEKERPRVIPQVQLRAMSDVKPAAPQQNLGYFAPPLTAREVRARRARDYVIWGCLAVMIASVFAVGMWFLAR